MSHSNKTYAFPASTCNQMGTKPITNVVLHDSGMDIERRKFATLWGKTTTQHYQWEEIQKIELRKYTPIPFAWNYVSHQPIHTLQIYTRNSVIRINVSDKDKLPDSGGIISERKDFLKLLTQLSGKQIETVQYTRLLSERPFIILAVIIGIAATPFIFNTQSVSVKAQIIVFGLIFGLIGVCSISYRKTRRSA